MHKKFGCGLRMGPNTSPYCRNMPWMPKGWKCQISNPINLLEDNLSIKPQEKQEYKKIIIKNLESQLHFFEQQVELIKKQLKELGE